MTISPLAGKPAPSSLLVDIPRLIDSYYSDVPDCSVPIQRVSFGTSGHRGSSFEKSFNETHILAITQAICLYRQQQNIAGPLFIGRDTHALSLPAWKTAVEVLAANGVTIMLSKDDEYTPTPAISLAILNYNYKRKAQFADGIVITPSHNPPEEGGFKYNPPEGGPAEPEVTNWIQAKANEFIQNGLVGVKRMPLKDALTLPTTQYYDFLNAYVEQLADVIDMKVIRTSNIKLGVDPLGGAGLHYWKAIADRYDLNLTITNEVIDPTFSFMPVDYDGKIRMDPSSIYAMQRLIDLREEFDIAFACDTDYDRHGIVTKSSGLLPPNHYLSVAIFYLFQHRPLWKKEAQIGKSLVSSEMIDRVAAKLSRKVYEVPVGFKYFVSGLMDGSLAFVGEESAGASFSRFNGGVWTTDKDGIISALLAAEITAKMGKDPGKIYEELTQELGSPLYGRFEAPATLEQKKILKTLCAADVKSTELAGEPIENIFTNAPGDGAPIGGLKVVAKNGWFAARPSGTEDIYKIYVESFLGEEHFQRIRSEAQQLVNQIITPKSL